MPSFDVSTGGGTKVACLLTLKWEDLVEHATEAVRDGALTITGVRLTPDANLPFDGTSRVRLCDLGGKVLSEVRAAGGRRVGRLPEPVTWGPGDGDLLIVWVDDKELAPFDGQVAVSVAHHQE